MNPSQLYESEERLGLAFNVFTVLVLFIEAMSLFGLVFHSVVPRTREIGIRKMLGSSSLEIKKLHSCEAFLCGGRGILFQHPFYSILQMQLPIPSELPS